MESCVLYQILSTDQNMKEIFKLRLSSGMIKEGYHSKVAFCRSDTQIGLDLQMLGGYLKS